MDDNINHVAKKFGLTKEDVKDWILPAVGTTFDLLDIRYRVTYIKANPYRFTAVPIMPAPPEKENTSGQSK